MSTAAHNILLEMNLMLTKHHPEEPCGASLHPDWGSLNLLQLVTVNFLCVDEHQLKCLRPSTEMPGSSDVRRCLDYKVTTQEGQLSSFGSWIQSNNHLLAQINFVVGCYDS